MEQVKAGSRVIGTVTYVGRDDVWSAESIHQPGKPVIFHDPEDARDWIRELHADETPGHQD